MLHRIGIFLTIATLLLAQGQEIHQEEIQRARHLLKAPSWEEKAWGLHIAASLHSRSLDQDLLAQLQSATRLIAADPKSIEHAYVSVLFEALIESGVTVQAQLLEPFLESWTAPALILLVRAPDSEATFLLLSSERKGDLVWLTSNNVLAWRRSKAWYQDMLRQLSTTHIFSVFSPNQPEYGIPGGHGDGIARDQLEQMPAGFPPVILYSLASRLFPGSTLLTPGPINVYFRRTVVPTGQSFHPPSSEGYVSRLDLWYGYLAELSRKTTDEVQKFFKASTTIIFTTDLKFVKLCDQSLTRQAEGLQRLIQLIAETGLFPSQSQFLIEVGVYDHRKWKHHPLPEIRSRVVTLPRPLIQPRTRLPLI
ncbi:MAG: hypothetical protein NTW74_12800 [Acidobacteria bacterium]|nr:hypothetical protein [Acidobacteriota bacterium]